MAPVCARDECFRTSRSSSKPSTFGSDRSRIIRAGRASTRQLLFRLFAISNQDRVDDGSADHRPVGSAPIDVRHRR